LKQLQTALESYIRQGSFIYFKMTTTTEIDDSAFKVQALAPAQADAVRADFLVYNERITDARALLDRVLQQDPNNVSAQETLGYLEFRQGHFEEARKRYAQAVQLDSQNFLAHYYFAAISIDNLATPSEDAQLESSLRTAIKLNPSFAPAFNLLAVFLGMRQRNLEEARMMGLSAVTLEPANIDYRVNVANVLMAAGQSKNAILVLRNAAKLAKTPQETQAVDNSLMRAQEYAAMQERMGERNRLVSEMVEAGQEQAAPSGAEVPSLAHRKEFVPSGPRRFVVGVLKDIHCEAASLDLTVTSGTKTIVLYTDNYYKLPFTSLNFQPSGDLKPCRDLENRPAKVEYVDSADKAEVPHLIAIELHK
jgi:Tfp pilus assembly protein PilF